MHNQYAVYIMGQCVKKFNVSLLQKISLDLLLMAFAFRQMQGILFHPCPHMPRPE
jgi:hypothetical protein